MNPRLKATVLSFLFVFVISAGPAFAKGADKKLDPIEQREEDCIDKDGSTAGMCDCAEKAYAEWDSELNRYYKLLMSKLSVRQRPAFAAAQVQWLKFRDAEFKHIDSLYRSLEGTMYRPMQVESRIHILRDRVVQLRAYDNLLKEGG